jgi:UDP-galactopyranose mutase
MASTEQRPLIVVGAGISGLTLAWRAARGGATPLVLEAGSRVGGCLDSREDDGFWFELGAHTLYNSYGSLLEVAEGCATPPRIIARGDQRKRFGLLRNGSLSTMGPLSVLRQFSFLPLALRAPFNMFRSKEGLTTAEHFGRVVGSNNYRRVLAPFLSAVPSQPVDEFPATGPGSLFKKRPRRKDVIKSFTFDGGAGAVAGAIAKDVDIELDAAVSAIARTDDGYQLTLEDGREYVCAKLALAVDPATAARLLSDVQPALAAALGRIDMVSVESVGVVVDKAATALPELAFVVPTDDIFWSAVTRDPVPDGRRRAFTFHFKPGHDDAAKRARISEVLGIDEPSLPPFVTKRTVLPAPGRDHAATVGELDRLLAGGSLALTGNYFDGLAIEDCSSRSKSEWQRLSR